MPRFVIVKYKEIPLPISQLTRTSPLDMWLQPSHKVQRVRLFMQPNTMHICFLRKSFEKLFRFEPRGFIRQSTHGGSKQLMRYLYRLLVTRSVESLGVVKKSDKVGMSLCCFRTEFTKELVPVSVFTVQSLKRG